MAKAKGWLFSLEANGRMGRSMVGRNGRAGCSVAPYTAPGGSPSEAQAEWRKILRWSAELRAFALGYQKWNFDFLAYTARSTRMAKTANGYAAKMAIWGASILQLMQPEGFSEVAYRQRAKTSINSGIVTTNEWLDWPIFASTATDSIVDAWEAMFLTGMTLIWETGEAPVYDWQEIWLDRDDERYKYAWVEAEVPILHWDYARREWDYDLRWVPISGVVDWERLTWL